jgi:hypothetical protein
MTGNKYTIHTNGAKSCQQVTLSLLELLLRIRLEMKRGLAGLLVGGSFDPDLVICHNLLHDLTKSRRLAISTCRGKVDRRQSERFCHLSSLDCKTGAGGSAPSRCDWFGSSTRRRRKGWKRILRLGVEGSEVLMLRDWGRVRVRRERVWCTVELVQSLRCAKLNEYRMGRGRANDKLPSA